MQKAVQDAGTVLDWMKGTRELIQENSPQFRAAVMQAFDLQTEDAWQAKRTDLLAQLDASMQTTQAHGIRAIQSGSPPQAVPFVPAEKFGAVFQSAMEETLNDRVTSAVQAQAEGAQIGRASCRERV
jgi:cystathionine beta-lyase family protein involved in aluminum resistance